jgi:hypothetical protein
MHISKFAVAAAAAARRGGGGGGAAAAAAAGRRAAGGGAAAAIGSGGGGGQLLLGLRPASSVMPDTAATAAAAHSAAPFVPDINALHTSVERDDVPPPGLPPTLQSLWFAAKGSLTLAHDALMLATASDDQRNVAWVRAHLCRASNGPPVSSRRWYEAAARPVVAASTDLCEEWEQIATTLLGDMLQRGLADTDSAAAAAAEAAAHITNPTEYLEALGMRAIPHGSRNANLSEGSFMDHLLGVERAMRGWDLDPSLCLAGLFHSVYGTQGFAYYTLPLAQRPKVRELIGARGELAVYYNCVMDRAACDELVLATVAAGLAEGGEDLAVPGLLRARPNRRTGMTGHETFALTLGELKDLVTLCECEDVLCAVSKANPCAVSKAKGCDGY